MAGSSELFKLVGRILIDNADAIDKINDTTEKAKGLGDALDGTGTSADTASSKMGSTSKLNTAAVWLGNTLYKLSEKAVSLGTNLGKIGFGFNMSMESYQYSFSALLQDEEKAKQLVADIQELAKVSPLGLEGLAKNAVSLLNTGTELTEIIPTLEMLGDLALGNPQNMDSVVRAFTQIISKGGLMAQEMYQLGDAMVPIKEIMTKYGGERYADGSWYEQKMKDPTYKIPAEDMVKAFKAATSEGGQWNDYMLTMMETFAGQYDRLGEEGKETLGDFFKPFFEMAKSDVLPGLIESLDKFRTWISDNKESLEKMAEAVGGLVTTGFDKFLGAIQWMTENGEATKNALIGIATAMTLSAIAAHPYAAAIMAVAAGLAWLTSEEGKRKMNSDHLFDGHDQEALEALQEWVEAKRAWKEADDTFRMNVSDEEYYALVDAADAAAQKVNALDGELIGLYEAWRTNQENGLEYLDVPMQVSEDSEAQMQTDLENMTLEAYAKIYGDYSALYSGLDNLGLTGQVTVPSGSVPGVKWNADGAVFSKPTIFGTRMGLQGVGEAGAEAIAPIGVLQSYVSDAVASQNSGMVSVLQSILSTLNQINTNTASGHNVVLESGALVGQLAPALDTQLGTISSRKGRRN